MFVAEQMQYGPFKYKSLKSWTCSGLPWFSTILTSPLCLSNDVFHVKSLKAFCRLHKTDIVITVFSSEDTSAFLSVNARLGTPPPLMFVSTPSTSLSKRALYLPMSSQKVLFSASSSSSFFYRRRNVIGLILETQKKKLASTEMNKVELCLGMTAHHRSHAPLHYHCTMKNNHHPLTQLLYSSLKCQFCLNVLSTLMTLGMCACVWMHGCVCWLVYVRVHMFASVCRAYPLAHKFHWHSTIQSQFRGWVSDTKISRLHTQTLT